MSGAGARLRWPDIRLLLIAVVLFGGVWPVTKHALRDATPVWFAVSRAGLATLVLAVLVLALGRLRLPGPRDWPAVLAVGMLQLGGFFALTHLALPLVPAGRTAVLSNVTIIWLVPLSVLLLGERLPARRWAAAGLGLAGAGVLVGPWAVDWGDPRVLGGHLLLLLAPLSWSLAIVATRIWPPQRPMLDLLPWCFALGTALLVALALLREPRGGIGPGAWPHAAFIGFFAAPLGTWSVIEAGRRLPGSVASVGFMLVPVLGLAGGALWLGEPMGWDVWLGTALILGSVVLAVRG